VAIAAGGCGGSDHKRAATTPADASLPAGVGGPAGEAVIRGWTRAVYAGDYRRAGSFFARRAIVQQSVTIVLATPRDAVAFSRSLPCRAKVTSILHEPHGVLLASFDLFPGLDGRCQGGGTARVRFFVRDGRIEVWRQLPDAPAPPSQST
jgi:hypothetical protein